MKNTVKRGILTITFLTTSGIGTSIIFLLLMQWFGFSGLALKIVVIPMVAYVLALFVKFVSDMEEHV